MPYEIKFEKPPVGYAAKSARKGQGDVSVIYREFLTSEDGMLLIKRLEGFATQVINMLPEKSKIRCSKVDHMLVHFDKHGKGVAYVNELSLIATARVRKTVEKGELVYRDDIVEYEEVRFEGINVPEDHAVIVVMSSGWRKLHYFDFGTINPDAEGRDYDLWSLLGSLYNYLIFQEVLGLSEESWDLLMNNGWFPFVGIGSKNFDNLMGWLREGDSGDEALPAIYSELLDRLPQIQNAWEEADIFAEHISVLRVAIERFKVQDWISCNSILYSRIEGVLRVLAKITNSPTYKQSDLSAAPSNLSDLKTSQHSRILPHRFNEFLSSVFFKNFDPENPTEISRHTVGHGVAPAESFDKKAAIIGVLIIEQIFYHLPIKQKGSLIES